MSSAKRTPLHMIVLVLAIAALAGACLWAGITIGRQSFRSNDETEPIYAEVSEEQLGRSILSTAQIIQDREPVGQNLLSGLLTARAESESFAPGDELYQVDGRAVRVAQGAVPFYRDLTLGVAGQDVQQLQDLLVTLGYLNEADGVYGEATKAGVISWQKANGEPDTGVIPRGTLVAVPRLPSPLFVSDEVRIGTSLSGSETMVYVPAGDPVFELVVTEQVAAQVLPGMKVDLGYEGAQWQGVISEGAPREDAGVVYFPLVGADGGDVCGDDCVSLPAQPRISVSADVTVVEDVRGTAVPTTALTLARGGQFTVNVVDDDHVEAREVEVISTQGGLSIITNVSVGEKVVLP